MYVCLCVLMHLRMYVCVYKMLQCLPIKPNDFQTKDNVMDCSNLKMYQLLKFDSGVAT
jgi:hypothetical protein